jgi:hypothetical protein
MSLSDPGRMRATTLDLGQFFYIEQSAAAMCETGNKRRGQGDL